MSSFIKWLEWLFCCCTEMKDTPDAPQTAKAELEKLGPLSLDEKITAGAFAVTVGLWIFGGSVGINAVAAALLGLSILLVTNVVKWKDCLGNALCRLTHSGSLPHVLCDRHSPADTLSYNLLSCDAFLHHHAALVCWYGQTQLFKKTWNGQEWSATYPNRSMHDMQVTIKLGTRWSGLQRLLLWPHT